MTTRYSAIVENNGTDIRFIESICTPRIEAADIPDRIDISSSVQINATISNSIPRKVERPMRVELIQNGVVKGWSPWIIASLGPEETIDLKLRAESWTWINETASHDGDYILCLSMRNSYGDIWLPMGQGKKVTVSDSAGIDTIMDDDMFEDAIYDLFGRKVNRPQDGNIYIQSGKKILIK